MASWPFSFVPAWLIFCVTVVLATNISNEFSSFIPSCAGECFTSFLNVNYAQGVCTGKPLLDCLCSRRGASGFTLGEGAMQCISAERSIGYCSIVEASDRVIENAYDICNGRPGAVHPTYLTITATLVLAPSGGVVTFPSVTTKTTSRPDTSSTIRTLPTTLVIDTSSPPAIPRPSTRPISSTTRSTAREQSTTDSSDDSDIISITEPPFTKPTTFETSTYTPTSSSESETTTDVQGGAGGASKDEDSDDSDKLSTEQVAGISVGVLAAVGVAVGAIVLARYYRRRKYPQIKTGFLPMRDTWGYKPDRSDNGGHNSWMVHQLRPDLDPTNHPPPPPTSNRRSVKPETIGVALSPPPSSRNTAVHTSPLRRLSKLLPAKPTLPDLSVGDTNDKPLPLLHAEQADGRRQDAGHSSRDESSSIPPPALAAAAWTGRSKPTPPAPLKLQIPQAEKPAGPAVRMSNRESNVTEFEEDRTSISPNANTQVCTEGYGGVKADNQHLLSTLQSTTYSDATADFIRSWITECQSTHILCGDDLLSLILGSTETKSRPRRLLDLLAFQDVEKIRIIEANDDHTKEYCALSYSWGFSKPYVMTSSNFAAFQKEIHVKDLPKLIQDSIQVVRGLGFRYLWIDALCIMQDGSQSSAASDDWVDQAGKMNDIFGNAVVTIAAAECFDGNSSMIVPRNPLSQLSCRLDASTNLYYEVVPSCTPHCLLHPFDKARFHLDTRAWVFQERILSPRTVHLTRNFVHLECRTELRCGAMGGSDACYHSGAIAKADYQVLFSMFGPYGLDESAQDAFLSFWHELVRRYSTTNLSRKSDLLVALAGLAKQVQTKSQLTWSFGLWQEYLLRDMLWYIRGGRGAPCRERSPTWSWASIDVQGPQIIYEPAARVSLLADIIGLPDATDFVRRGLLVDATKHCVKVSGLLRPGAPDSLKYGQNSASSMNKDIRVHRNCQGIQHIHRQCPFHPDYDLPNNIELYSLLIARASGAQQRMGSSQSSDTHVGIVLTHSPEHERRYRRVGYFHIDIQEVDDDDQGIPWILESSNFVEIEVI